MLSYTEHGKFRALVQGFDPADTQALWPDTRQKMTGQALPFPPIRRGLSAMSRIPSGSWDAHKRNIRGPNLRPIGGESSQVPATEPATSVRRSRKSSAAILRASAADHLARYRLVLLTLSQQSPTERDDYEIDRAMICSRPHRESGGPPT
jgi:hypothetical protein